MIHPPNIGPALHIHPTGAEAFYVLEGTYTIHCNTRTHLAESGDFVFIPTGTPHNYQSGSEGGKVLVLSREWVNDFRTFLIEKPDLKILEYVSD